MLTLHGGATSLRSAQPVTVLPLDPLLSNEVVKMDALVRQASTRCRLEVIGHGTAMPGGPVIPVGRNAQMAIGRLFCRIAGWCPLRGRYALEPAE